MLVNRLSRKWPEGARASGRIATGGELAGSRVAGGRREEERVPKVREEGRKNGHRLAQEGRQRRPSYVQEYL